MYTRTLLTESHTDTDADCMNVCVYISSGLVQRQGTTAPKCPQVYHSKNANIGFILRYWTKPNIILLVIYCIYLVASSFCNPHFPWLVTLVIRLSHVS